ncbi:MAG: LacI family transcriptional regulator [Pseudonocardiales bacterium]|jgi:LacI family transcriptional regulator|nr:LacI family transcriptional regulator [Pseudonocardiales bacterium]MDT7586616.1 LacI family transcriptional regulator [Pseudonocardiales bacterium]MDT7607750.1 LacI family transcriptional regulator [Pseudonocardiales bacterium]MDT7632104.1 LacI family transcriptional regulator [Pseudonocardiales bacterium]MDT7673690.1 LacI family transcriptional regulator [Pseudonocardiales bacterium]
MATITDVAARAGVSVATVSRTLNGKATVDPGLAARVRAAAAELGYQPNGLARSLRKRRTAVLALIISDVANPFFTSVARGVEDVALTAGYSVVLCNSDENLDKERRYLDMAVEERVAGVVLSPSGESTNVGALLGRGTPVVAVDRPLPGVDQVLVNTRLAAAEATAHLIRSGYQYIGCVTGPVGIRTADDRLAGYRAALAAAGRREDYRLVRRTEYRAEGAERATAELLLAGRVDALLVANSAQAIGVLEALRAAGSRLGADVGVVAFDDAPWATLIDPPLTVVAQPAYELGALAAELLLDRIRGATPEVTVRTLEARLIERGSSCRSPDSADTARG